VLAGLEPADVDPAEVAREIVQVVSSSAPFAGPPMRRQASQRSASASETGIMVSP
jgi:hypothetical protein